MLGGRGPRPPWAAKARSAAVTVSAIDLLDQAEPLGGREKGAREDQLAAVVTHPQENLELAGAVVGEVDDRLGDEHEPLLLDRDADPLGPGDAAAHAPCGGLPGRIDGDPVAPGLLRVVHREVGADQDVLAAGGVVPPRTSQRRCSRSRSGRASAGP